MSDYQAIVDQADQLPLLEKIRLIEHLSAALKQDLEEEAFKRMPWHDFVERTAGILSDAPIQRWPEGDFEDREPLE